MSSVQCPCPYVCEILCNTRISLRVCLLHDICMRLYFLFHFDKTIVVDVAVAIEHCFGVFVCYSAKFYQLSTKLCWWQSCVVDGHNFLCCPTNRIWFWGEYIKNILYLCMNMCVSLFFMFYGLAIKKKEQINVSVSNVTFIERCAQ